MKAYLIAFVIVMASTTVLNNSPSPPPQALPVGLKDIDMNHALSAQRQDGLSGDFILVDKARDFTAATSVKDTATPEQIDLPQVGRF